MTPEVEKEKDERKVEIKKEIEKEVRKIDGLKREMRALNKIK